MDGLTGRARGLGEKYFSLMTSSGHCNLLKEQHLFSFYSIKQSKIVREAFSCKLSSIGCTYVSLEALPLCRHVAGCGGWQRGSLCSQCLPRDIYTLDTTTYPAPGQYQIDSRSTITASSGCCLLRFIGNRLLTTGLALLPPYWLGSRRQYW